MKLAESSRLGANRIRPEADDLRALLEECRDRAYNVCVQVLRDGHQAEDATQEALLQIAKGVAKGIAPRHFDPWMYRVAFHTALNLLKKNRRRRDHENRKARMVVAPPPADDARDAVHAAMAELDDEARSAIILHFFEQRTLDDIAHDQRVSAVAVWKRIERAKEALKRSLERSGLGAFAGWVGPVLQSIRPSIAPAGLVSEPFVRRTLELLSSPVPGTVAALGGTIMTAKGITFGTLAGFSMFLFLTGVGGGYFLNPSSSPNDPELRDLRTSPSSAGNRPAACGASAPAMRLEVSAAVPAPGLEEPLLLRLQSLAALMRERDLALKTGGSLIRYQQLYYKCNEAWRALQKEAYDEAATLFEFLRSANNKDLFEGLLAMMANAAREDGGSIRFSPSFVDAWGGLLRTGTAAQRKKLAECAMYGAFYACGLGPQLQELCFARLSVETDPSVLATLLQSLWIDNGTGFDGIGKIEAQLGLVGKLWETHAARTNEDRYVREQSLEVLARTRTPAGMAMFLEKVNEALYGNDEIFQRFLPDALHKRLEMLKPGEEDRYLPILTTAFATTTNPYTYLSYASVALDLPLPKAELALAEAWRRAPDGAPKAGLDRALSLIRGGETRSYILQRSLRNP